MPGIDEYYSNYGKSTYSSGNTYTPLYSTSSSYGTSKYEQNMHTYLFLSSVCTASEISFSGYSSTRSMSRSDNIELPSEWTNKGVF